MKTKKFILSILGLFLAANAVWAAFNYEDINYIFTTVNAKPGKFECKDNNVNTCFVQMDKIGSGSYGGCYQTKEEIAQRILDGKCTYAPDNTESYSCKVDAVNKCYIKFGKAYYTNCEIGERSWNSNFDTQAREYIQTHECTKL